MAITTAITDLFKSFYELIVSVFSTAYTILHTAVTSVFGFISGLLNLVGGFLSGVVDLTGSVGKFVAGNIVLLSIGAIGAVAYMRYTAHGRQLAASKKTQ